MRVASVLALTILMQVSVLHAADDPTIPKQRKAALQQAMTEFIDANRVGDNFVVYDAVAGKLLRLRLAELHTGVVKKGEFYVSCADLPAGRVSWWMWISSLPQRVRSSRSLKGLCTRSTATSVPITWKTCQLGLTIERADLCGIAGGIDRRQVLLHPGPSGSATEAAGRFSSIYALSHPCNGITATSGSLQDGAR